jgi:hypothetical protein
MLHLVELPLAQRQHWDSGKVQGTLEELQGYSEAPPAGPDV